MTDPTTHTTGMELDQQPGTRAPEKRPCSPGRLSSEGKRMRIVCDTVQPSAPLGAAVPSASPPSPTTDPFFGARASHHPIASRAQSEQPDAPRPQPFSPAGTTNEELALPATLPPKPPTQNNSLQGSNRKEPSTTGTGTQQSTASCAQPQPTENVPARSSSCSLAILFPTFVAAILASICYNPSAWGSPGKPMAGEVFVPTEPWAMPQSFAPEQLWKESATNPAAGIYLALFQLVPLHAKHDVTAGRTLLTELVPRHPTAAVLHDWWVKGNLQALQALQSLAEDRQANRVDRAIARFVCAAAASDTDRQMLGLQFKPPGSAPPESKYLIVGANEATGEDVPCAVIYAFRRFAALTHEEQSLWKACPKEEENQDHDDARGEGSPLDPGHVRFCREIANLIQIITDGAERGHPLAIALNALFGGGDAETRMQMLRLAKEHGNALAHYGLGIHLAYGNGVFGDRQAALAHLRVAAGEGFQPAVAAVTQLEQGFVGTVWNYFSNLLFDDFARIILGALPGLESLQEGRQ